MSQVARAAQIKTFAVVRRVPVGWSSESEIEPTRDLLLCCTFIKGPFCMYSLGILVTVFKWGDKGYSLHPCCIWNGFTRIHNGFCVLPRMLHCSLLKTGSRQILPSHWLICDSLRDLIGWPQNESSPGDIRMCLHHVDTSLSSVPSDLLGWQPLGLNEMEDEVTLLHFTDIYNLPSRRWREPVGGAARLQTLLESYAHADPLVLFSGDALSPSLESQATKGSHMLDALNKLGVSAAVPGNHEFDFGLENFEEQVGRSSFPWVLSNLVQQKTGLPPSGVVPHLVVESHGHRVGLMGLVGDWMWKQVATRGETFVHTDPVHYGNILEYRSLWSEVQYQ